MILVLGGTGTVGSEVVRALAKHPVEIEVVSTSAAHAELPSSARGVQGDVRDVDLMRGLLARTRTLFILNPVVADELTRALVTLSLAVDAGIQRVVYFSMLGADTWTDVPHAAAKFAAERMIADRGIPASILRPCYFFQNDVWRLASRLGRRLRTYRAFAEEQRDEWLATRPEIAGPRAVTPNERSE
jgi:uncharacterized protein YbjT (DUF2867 family)